jgi:two-component system OmpR family response regulator
VFVGRLRKKLGVDIIQTARGLGYIVDGEPAPAKAER